MSDQPIGKDGLARVLARTKLERKLIKRGMVEHNQRVIKEPFNTHAGMNVFVEYERVPNAAYYRGHMLYLYFAINLITTGLLIWKW